MEIIKKQLFSDKTKENVVPQKTVILSPGVDLKRQQRILESRRRGNNNKFQSTPNLARGTPSRGGAAGAGGSGGKSQGEGHTECRTRERELRVELENYVKYVENQAITMQRMEQTIQQQYLIIQQLTCQIEAIVPQAQSQQQVQQSSKSQQQQQQQSSANPLTELTKQFEQQFNFGAFADMLMQEDGGRAQKGKKRSN